MPRRPRIDFAGFHHIVNRGVARSDVFREKRDKEQFLQIVCKACKVYKVNVHDYCLMDNHFHLLIELTSENLSLFMRQINSNYAIYFNKKYDRSGALFQGRFKKIHIDNERYLQWLIGYVNGNIEIHGLGKVSDYPWSSYQAVRKELNSFLQKEEGGLSNLSVLSGLDIVLSQFASVGQFEEFIGQVTIESKINKKMKKYFLE